MPRKTHWWEKGEPRVKSHAQVRREGGQRGGGCAVLILGALGTVGAVTEAARWLS